MLRLTMCCIVLGLNHYGWCVFVLACIATAHSHPQTTLHSHPQTTLHSHPQTTLHSHPQTTPHNHPQTTLHNHLQTTAHSRPQTRSSSNHRPYTTSMTVEDGRTQGSLQSPQTMSEPHSTAALSATPQWSGYPNLTSTESLASTHATAAPPTTVASLGKHTVIGSSDGHLTTALYCRETPDNGLYYFHVSKERSIALFTYKRTSSCNITVTVPENNVLRIRLQHDGQNSQYSVQDIKAVDASGRSVIPFRTKYGKPNRYFYWSSTSQVTFHLLMERWNCNDRNRCFKLELTPVPWARRPKVEVHNESPVKGYAHLVPFDKNDYPLNIDTCTHIAGPVGHSVFMVLRNQVKKVDWCWLDRVSLYKNDGRRSHRVDTATESTHCTESGTLDPASLVWKTRGTFYQKAGLHDMDKFRVHYKSFASKKSDSFDYMMCFTDFKVLFYFTNPETAPSKLPGGKWNCSVPGFDVQFFFPCDLAADCVADEDEIGCSYRSGKHCGPGEVSVGTSCYRVHLNKRKPLSWWKAAKLCGDVYSGHLPIPKTIRSWNKLHRFLGKYVDYGRGTVPIGVKVTLGSHLPRMYQVREYITTRYGSISSWMAQWWDETIAYNVVVGLVRIPGCLFFRHTSAGIASHCFSDTRNEFNTGGGHDVAAIFCQVHKHGESPTKQPPAPLVKVTNATGLWKNPTYVVCPEGHYTHTFLSCDARSTCWSRGGHDASVCKAKLSPLPPTFLCDNGVQRVSYTLICDHRPDCGDLSDEDFCHFPLADRKHCDAYCHYTKPEPECQLTSPCLDPKSQWSSFGSFKSTRLSPRTKKVSPPAIVHFHGYGNFTVSPLNTNGLADNSSYCPQSHFLCWSNGFCLPVFVRCNGVYDCPEHEDEDCLTYTCQGLYRCLRSTVCLHPDQMCDATVHCPYSDDETLCKVEISRSCPDYCTCYGAAVFCSRTFNPSSLFHLRFVDAGGSGMTLRHFHNNTMLVHLGLASCGITVIDNNVSFPNLHNLDLSWNSLVHLKGFVHLNDNGVSGSQLRVLSLAGNPLTDPLKNVAGMNMTSLQTLDLSFVAMAEIDLASHSLPNTLLEVNFSHSGVLAVMAGGFTALEQLRTVDLSRCPVWRFPPDIFRPLKFLHRVRADNFKLCCSDVLPTRFNALNCQAPAPIGEVSSCKDLLFSDGYRFCLAVLACLAVSGNIGSFVFRLMFDKSSTKFGFNVFVTHLCAADFVMGIYLVVIGVADYTYKGSYLWKDETWRHSVPCKMAGFASFVSCEVSALIICLITLDRFLVLRFPFSVVHFGPRSAHAACSLAWGLGLCLGAVPPLALPSHWEFYTQSGICIPLPVVKRGTLTHSYSFAVMTILNFALCLLTSVGQVFVYQSVRSNVMQGDSAKRSVNTNVARRLLTVALSDFLCWFPVGCAGILSHQGVSLPGDLNVAMAILVLPLNSAINPFLYTLNVLLEKRRLAREERLYNSFLAKQGM